MTEEQLKYFRLWFNEFVERFVTHDKEIQLQVNGKKDHTVRVCNTIRKIGESIKLDADELNLLEAIALFHDIGRFEQYINYKTSFDFIKDHGEMGVKMLEHFKVLEVSSEDEKSIILKCVKYHNVYALPKEESERILFFLKMIRDADKLDLYHLHVKCLEEKNNYHKSVLKLVPDTLEYSTKVVESLLNNECVKYYDIRTYNDYKLSFIGWIFDINYTYSIREIKDNKYIERVTKNLPDTDDIRKVYLHAMEYIENLLNSRDLLG